MWCRLASGSALGLVLGTSGIKFNQEPGADDGGILLGGREGAQAAQPQACLADDIPEPTNSGSGHELPFWQLCPKDYPEWQASSSMIAPTGSRATNATSSESDADKADTTPDEDDYEASAFGRAAAFEWADYGDLPAYDEEGVTSDMDRGDEAGRISLGQCPIFVQTTKNYATQKDARLQNVAGLFNMSSDINIKPMEVVYWRHDWDAVTKLFEKIRASICFYIHYKCNASPNKGQIARWATMLMATAYQRKFKLPCMILMEDDIHPYANFGERLARFSMPANESRIMKFSTWGDGYAFNLLGVEEYHRRIYKYGVTATIDWWINKNMEDITTSATGLVRYQVVGSNNGDIMNSDKVSKKMFSYDTASHDDTWFTPLLDAFENPDDLDLAAALYRFLGEAPPPPLSELKDLHPVNYSQIVHGAEERDRRQREQAEENLQKMRNRK